MDTSSSSAGGGAAGAGVTASPPMARGGQHRRMSSATVPLEETFVELFATGSPISSPAMARGGQHRRLSTSTVPLEETFVELFENVGSGLEAELGPLSWPALGTTRIPSKGHGPSSLEREVGADAEAAGDDSRWLLCRKAHLPPKGENCKPPPHSHGGDPTKAPTPPPQTKPVLSLTASDQDEEDGGFMQDGDDGDSKEGPAPLGGHSGDTNSTQGDGAKDTELHTTAATAGSPSDSTAKTTGSSGSPTSSPAKDGPSASDGNDEDTYESNQLQPPPQTKPVGSPAASDQGLTASQNMEDGSFNFQLDDDDDDDHKAGREENATAQGDLAKAKDVELEEHRKPSALAKDSLPGPDPAASPSSAKTTPAEPSALPTTTTSASPTEETADEKWNAYRILLSRQGDVDSSFKMKGPLVRLMEEGKELTERGQSYLRTMYYQLRTLKKTAEGHPSKWTFKKELRDLKHKGTKSNALVVMLAHGLVGLKAHPHSERDWICQYISVSLQGGKFHPLRQQCDLSRLEFEALLSDWGVGVATDWKDQRTRHENPPEWMNVYCRQFLRSWEEGGLKYLGAKPRVDGGVAVLTTCDNQIQIFPTREDFYSTAEGVPPRDILNEVFDVMLEKRVTEWYKFPAGASLPGRTLDFSNVPLINGRRNTMLSWDCHEAALEEATLQLVKDGRIGNFKEAYNEEHLIAAKAKWAEYQVPKLDSKSKDRVQLRSSGFVARYCEAMNLRSAGLSKDASFESEKLFSKKTRVMVVAVTKSVPMHCVVFIKGSAHTPGGEPNVLIIDPSEEHALTNTPENCAILNDEAVFSDFKHVYFVERKSGKKNAGQQRRGEELEAADAECPVCKRTKAKADFTKNKWKNRGECIDCTQQKLRNRSN